MGTLTYPPSLPSPTAAPLQPAERRMLTDMPGPVGARGLQRDWLAMQRVEFVLSQAQAEAWRTWWRDSLVMGGAWFAADWPVPTGWHAVSVRRFVGEPSWSLIPGYGWRVTGECELRGRGELPQRHWRIERTDQWLYRTALHTDSADYSAPDYDDTDWPVGQGPFGDGPHTSPDGWPDPNTIIPTDGMVWMRKRANVPSLGPISITLKADNVPTLWINGDVVSLANPTSWIFTATFVPADAALVLVLRVVNSIPPSSPNPIYAGLEAYQ